MSVARTLLALACLLALPSVLFGQSDTTAPGLRLQFSAPALRLQQPAVLRVPGLGAPHTLMALERARSDSGFAAALDSARAVGALARRSVQLYGRQPVEPQEEAPPEREGLFGISPKYADLSLDGQARLELRTERFRNERCNAVLLLDPNSGCRGGFKAPRIDNTFQIRSGGIIGKRVHLKVDYDSERDFSGNQDVQLYYQGLEDEIVRRVEIGSVAFQPPPSRFLTAAIPSNNFGVNASFELGPIQLQTLFATQKGSVVAERTYTIGQTTSQPQDRQVRDLDFESGRFFWAVDPSLLPDYPAVDILNVDPSTLPTTERPAEVRVYRYRITNSPVNDPNLAGIPAIARSGDGRQQVQGRWQLLIQGADYYVDPSGLWFALANKLGQDDYLAVSYRTAAGTLVGTFPAGVSPDTAIKDTLRLVADPKRGPEFQTFRYEMRQVYRVAGSDLQPGSLDVSLSLNRSERPASGASTYLDLLGLAQASDPTQVDADNRLFPRTRDPGASQILHDNYLIFPELTPFASSVLASAERSDSLYRTPLYLLFTQGPPSRFQFRFQYNSVGGGDRSTLDLNALQIREGSEHLTVGGRTLVRGEDYTISYDLGQVTFNNPDALFGVGRAATVTARFEEKGIFAVAPTSILGFSTRYSLGETGSINLIGMYQSEQSAYNRPQLGFEAKANLVGGLNTDLHFKPNVVTRLLNSLVSDSAVAPSRLDLNAEVAFTRPDPNRSGSAYLEEFEGDAGLIISLNEALWEFGSKPQSGAGMESFGYAAGLDSADAVALTWQNLIPDASGTGVLELHPRDIDPTIQIFGKGEQQETAMFVTLHPDSAGGYPSADGSHLRWTMPTRPFAPRWRSIVTALSPTGLDLSRDEYLEFWVFEAGDHSADSAGVRLVIDLGSVNEDALAIAPESLTVVGGDTVFSGRQYVGVGLLNTERTATGTFNAGTDDNGILGDRPEVIQTPDGPLNDVALCRRELTASVPVFFWGDLASRCTNGNAHLDTEDLNADFALNATGATDNVMRFVVDLADPRYFVRTGITSVDSKGRTAGWRLYRVPLRSPDATIGSPNIRLVQAMRITVATPPDLGGTDITARFALARMRFVGSPWVRRADAPIQGIAGATAAPQGEVISSIVSTENAELGYTPPPGVTNATNLRGGSQSDQGIQINEKSLRLIARGLEQGQRAEAYLRFPTGPQNLLNYKELRLWVRGRGIGWEDGQLQAYVKLGSDNDNFYLYRSSAHTTGWEPEMVINLDTWRRLRADIESRWLRGDKPGGAAECGVGLSTAYVACDGPYVVHLQDPGVNPPNLAAVQEISAGMYRLSGTAPIPETELWVDDIRVTDPVAQLGQAVALEGRLAASDVGTLDLSFVRQNGQFRQIGQDPSYKASNALRVATTWRLDRFLPTGLGLSIPVTLDYTRTGEAPELLSGTDLRASALDGLRPVSGWTANYNMSIRRNRPGTNWLVRGFADPLTFTAAISKARNTTELTQSSAGNSNYNLTYNLAMGRHGFALPLGGLLSWLPDWISKSEAGEGLSKARVNLVPTNIRMSSTLTTTRSNLTNYQVPIIRPEDSLLAPSLSLQRLWRNTAGMTWQPLGMLTLNGDVVSTRDLRHYADSTPIGRLASLSRRSLAGMDIGVERDRSITTSLALAPRIASWLRPRFTTASSFVLSRFLTSRPLVRSNGDSTGAFILPQTLNNSRTREIGASVDLSRALRGLFGDSSSTAHAFARIRPIDISRRTTRTSTFDLAAFSPGLSYQLGLGGLDRFLHQEGASAVGATEVHNTTVAAGADLPLGFSGTLSYTNLQSSQFQRQPGGFVQTQVSQREWPVGSVRFTHTFNGGPLSVLALSTSFRNRSGTSTLPAVGAGSAVVNGISSSSISPTAQISLRNGMALTVGYNSLDQSTRANGTLTNVTQRDITGGFNYSFRLPSMISQSRKQVRSSLTLFSSHALTCLERAEDPDCLPISDILHQELRGGLDTDVSKSLTGGLEVGYSINEAKQFDQRTSTLYLQVNFQLSLYAGDYR